MYSVKGSWVGQTFALATGNDSGGKKSRIRRSKEERKTMIESFIKRYQKSNNGNFPSLNLTHKEVGGSFYTIREIVREIIQENRVLGPGQFCSEGKNDGNVALNYPLGSIASQPQGVMFQKSSERNASSKQEGNGQYSTLDWDAVQNSTEHPTDEMGEGADRSSASENLASSEHAEIASLEQSSNGNVKCVNVTETDSAHLVNHMQTNGTPEEPGKQSGDGSPVCKIFEAGEEPGQMGVLQANLKFPTEEVQVETFPLISVIKETEATPVNFDEIVDDFEAEKVKSSNSTSILDEVSSFDSASDLMTTNGTDSEVSVSSDSGGSSDMIIQHVEVNAKVNQHGEVNLKNDSVDSSSLLQIKDETKISHEGMIHISQQGDLTSKTVEQNNLQQKSTCKGSAYFNNSTVMNYNNGQGPIAASGNEKAKFGKSTTLDRLDIGSWKASRQETNPLLAFFKAFVDAFARIWSE